MIVVDIEASGVDYNKHSIVSIGALDFLIHKIGFTLNAKSGMARILIKKRLR